VNVIVDGMAASAASIVAMAGDTITMATGSVMMIHEAMSMAFGNAADLTKMAETLMTVTNGIADIYVAKTGIAKDEILQMQSVETWMSADEAVAKGFATAVSKDKSAVKNEFKLDAFRNTPESLKVEVKPEEPKVEASACQCDCPECEDGDCANCSHAGCDCAGCTCDQIENKEEPIIVNQAPDLSLYVHQLEMNKRK
jgi:ATP-dependent Clp protease protease subunit